MKIKRNGALMLELRRVQEGQQHIDSPRGDPADDEMASLNDPEHLWPNEQPKKDCWSRQTPRRQVWRIELHFECVVVSK